MFRTERAVDHQATGSRRLMMHCSLGAKRTSRFIKLLTLLSLFVPYYNGSYLRRLSSPRSNIVVVTFPKIILLLGSPYLNLNMNIFYVFRYSVLHNSRKQDEA